MPGRATPLANGDKVRVPAIRPTSRIRWSFTGYVFRPGQFEYHAGLRLSRRVPSFEELRPDADPHYIMIRRDSAARRQSARSSPQTSSGRSRRAARPRILCFGRATRSTSSICRRAARVYWQPMIKTLELQASPDNPAQVVSIDGRVKAPGRYPLEPTMRVSDLIRAGGSLDDAAFGGEAELTRYRVVAGQSRQSELIQVDLDAIRRGDASADLTLEPYDVLVIKPIPQWVQPGIIELAGEVRFPGKYPIHQGETLHSVLHPRRRIHRSAFPEGAVFIREELKKREKDQLDLLAKRLQSDLASLSLEAVAGSAGDESRQRRRRCARPRGRSAADESNFVTPSPSAGW